jgi:hypothetical protein
MFLLLSRSFSLFIYIYTHTHMHSLPLFLSSQCKMTKLAGSAPHIHTRQAKRKEIRSSWISWLHIYLIIVLGRIHIYMYVYIYINVWGWWYTMDDRLEFDDIAAFITLSLFSIVSTPSKRDQKWKRTTISRTKEGENEKRKERIQCRTVHLFFYHSFNLCRRVFLSLSLLAREKKTKKTRHLSVVMYVHV